MQVVYADLASALPRPEPCAGCLLVVSLIQPAWAGPRFTTTTAALGGGWSGPVPLCLPIGWEPAAAAASDSDKSLGSDEWLSRVVRVFVASLSLLGWRLAQVRLADRWSAL